MAVLSVDTDGVRLVASVIEETAGVVGEAIERYGDEFALGASQSGWEAAARLGPAARAWTAYLEEFEARVRAAADGLRAGADSFREAEESGAGMFRRIGRDMDPVL